MSVPNRTGVPEKTSQTEQYVLNYSFDEVYKILMVGLAGYNSTSGNYDRLQVDNTTGGILVKSVGGGIASTVNIQDTAGNALTSTSGALNVAGSFSSTAAVANNSYGTTTSLADATTATLVNIASSTAGYKITGLSCTGTGDGYFFVTVAGSTIFSGRTSFNQPSVTVTLPNPITITTASAVTLKVTNKSGSTADFEGTLLGA